MVIVSCPTKFHAFNLAEQLDERGKLAAFFTVYHEKKNPLIARFNSRVDNENISLNRIHTLPFLSVYYKLGKSDLAVKIFDKYVANQLKKIDFEVIICWAGLSLETVKEAKRLGKKVILERGSVHLEVQQELLANEYVKFQIPFQSNSSNLNSELEEYEVVDYISVPSNFARDSFIKKGFKPNKLLVNGYGANQVFLQNNEGLRSDNVHLKIVFFGNISLQKGVVYLLDAIKILSENNIKVDCELIGKLSTEVAELIRERLEGVKLSAFMPQNKLSKYLAQFDVAVFPSIQDGYGMVVPQSLVSGLPVIVSEHVGAKDLIEDGVNGFVVPVCNAEAIAKKISYLDSHRDKLLQLKNNAKAFNQDLLNWSSYGHRYEQLLEQKVLINREVA